MTEMETMLTIEDIMENLHIERRQALKLLKLDGFPSVKLGKKYLIPLQAYTKWVKSVINTEITI